MAREVRIVLHKWMINKTGVTGGDIKRRNLNGVTVAGLAEDLQQSGVGDKEEAWKHQTLALQVPAQCTRRNDRSPLFCHKWQKRSSLFCHNRYFATNDGNN